MTARRLALAALILAVVAAFLLFDLGQYLTLDYLKGRQDAIEDFRRANAGLAIGIYFALYVAVTALSLR